MVAIDTLTLDPANARKHDTRNMDAIKASLQRFGPQWPLAVVTRDNVVRAGNGRIQAARELGWKEVPIIYTDLEGVDAVAFAIADNRTAELAAWDDDVLAATLQSLVDEAPELLEVAGFTGDELEKLAGVFSVDGGGMPALKDGDREPFQQMTFTLHDSQVETVKLAMDYARSKGGEKSLVNENTNGNALAWLAERVLAQG
jgi:ParB-like chromosome segregation protein Spo0J